MQARNYSVDYAKAIGIILVVYGHVATGIYNAGINVPVELYKLIDSIIYSFHMPLFFFLSGLFFYKSFVKRGALKLVNSKIDSILYPYIIWSIIQGLIQARLSTYTNSDSNYNEIFFILWSPIAQFWFLHALFVFFCLSVIIFSIINRKYASVIFLLSIAVYIIPVLPNELWFLSKNFVFFLFGIIFSFKCNINMFLSKKSMCVLFALFIFGQYVFHIILGMNYTEKGVLSLLLSIISILFVISLSSFLSRTPNRLFITIGKSSLVIYLMHILAGSGVRVILKNFMGVDSHIIHLICGFIAGLFIPVFASIMIKKLSMQYLLSAPISHSIELLFRRLKPA